MGPREYGTSLPPAQLLWPLLGSPLPFLLCYSLTSDLSISEAPKALDSTGHLLLPGRLSPWLASYWPGLCPQHVFRSLTWLLLLPPASLAPLPHHLALLLLWHLPLPEITLLMDLFISCLSDLESVSLMRAGTSPVLSSTVAPGPRIQPNIYQVSNTFLWNQSYYCENIF